MATTTIDFTAGGTLQDWEDCIPARTVRAVLTRHLGDTPPDWSLAEEAEELLMRDGLHESDCTASEWAEWLAETAISEIGVPYAVIAKASRQWQRLHQAQ